MEFGILALIVLRVNAKLNEATLRFWAYRP
jgi:hypothetical protein